LSVLGRCSTVLFVGLAASAAAQATEPPRLVSAHLDRAPWNVQSAGIAACDVTVDENGAVAAADLVQDVMPYGAQLQEAVRSWRFEPASEGDRRVGSRVLVLGLFRPPSLSIIAPQGPFYQTTRAPEEIPWPTYVAIAPHPANVVGNAIVVVETDISDAGKVASARTLGLSTAFDEVALEAARQWTFRPAARAGRPIGSRAYLLFSFIGQSP
jgi:TonB family protein